jgi:hypothetical protein
MSVAYEAQSHDHGPDNRPNLGMSVEEVFLLKEGFSRRQKGPRLPASNRIVTDNEERNEQRKPLSRNIAPV